MSPDPLVQCPRCSATFAIHLSPQLPVQHAIVEWSENVFTDDRSLTASIMEDGALVLGLTNQDKKKVFMNVPLGKVVPQQQGEPAAFELIQIHPGVLKLNMSVYDPMLHAYLIIVGAPENWRENCGDQKEG